MAAKKDEKEDDWSYPSPNEMSAWLEREITDITKAADLRIRDATKFVTAYSRGDISAEQAEEGGYEYSQRWGNALPGVVRSKGMSDEEILAKVDEARKTKFADRVAQRQFRAPGREKRK